MIHAGIMGEKNETAGAKLAGVSFEQPASAEKFHECESWGLFI